MQKLENPKFSVHRDRVSYLHINKTNPNYGNASARCA